MNVKARSSAEPEIAPATHTTTAEPEKKKKHSTRKYPRKTDDFVPILRKQGINSSRSDQETRTVGDVLTDA